MCGWPIPEKSAIINADDLGFSRAINEGIFQAHANGIVTSATLAANMPAAQQACGALAEHQTLGVGVHLNFCQGPCLSDLGRAMLAGSDGQMNRSAVGLIFSCLVKPAILRAIEAEADAQIRRALDMGLRPTHLDSHRHAHAYLPIFRCVVRLARRYGISYIRKPIERLAGGGWAKSTGRGALTARLVSTCGAFGVFTSAWRLCAASGTWGIAHTGLLDRDWFIHCAHNLPAGLTEIMTHPGLLDPCPVCSGRLDKSRPAELEALCDPVVRQAFADAGVRLIHYGQLKDLVV